MPKDAEISESEKELRDSLYSRMDMIARIGYGFDHQLAKKMIGDHVVALVRSMMNNPNEYKDFFYEKGA